MTDYITQIPIIDLHSDIPTDIVNRRALGYGQHSNKTLSSSIQTRHTSRRVCGNLPDRHLGEIGRWNGVIGINAYGKFLDRHNPTIDRYVDHVVYVANLVGIEHVALGFDFMDYLPDSLGFSEKTAGLTCVEDVPSLIQKLHERGFSESEIERITFNNALRVFG